MSDNDSFYQTRQRGGSSAGKPLAPARPAPIFPPPPATPAPPVQHSSIRAVVTTQIASSYHHPPKPQTPAPAPSTPNKTLQPAGTSKSPSNSPVSPQLSNPYTTQTRLTSMSTLNKPPTHARQLSEIPPPPPEEEEASSNGRLSANEPEMRKHRLSTGVVVKGPREWQQRWVSLQGRHMLAGKKGCEHPIDIPVQGSIVVSDASDLKQPRFAVLSANGQMCYYFLSLSQGDRSQWLMHLIEQGATVITPPISDSHNDVDSKGWLKVLSPVGSNPAELTYLDEHVQRILEENNVRREAESLKLEALAGNMSQIELNKIKMKVSKLEADNSQMTTQLAKQKKHIAELEAKNATLNLSPALKESPLRPSISAAVFPSSVRRKTVDEDVRDPSVLAKDRIITDLQSNNARLQAELEALRVQVSQDSSTKQMLTTERDEALDLVEMVEKAKIDVEQAAEELLAQLTREKQDCEKTLRQAREDLANLQQKQMDEGHRLRQAEESLTAQANFEASAEELIAELTKAKEQSDEKVRRMEEMLHRQNAALSLPASTRQSIFVSPLQQPAQASAAELELMAEKMALLDEMCIQKEEYDELKQAYDALIARPSANNSASVEEASFPARESAASMEKLSEVSAVQGSQDLAAKWKQRLEQARLTSQRPPSEEMQISPALLAQAMRSGTPVAGARTLSADPTRAGTTNSRPPAPPTAAASVRSPSITPVRSPSGSLTSSTRDMPRPSPSTSVSARPIPGGKPLDLNSGYSSTRTLPPSPASSYGRESVTSSLRSMAPQTPFPSVSASARSNSTSSTSVASTSNSVKTTPASPPIRNTSIIDSRTRGKM